MTRPLTYRGIVYAAQPATIRDRIEHDDGSPYVASEISSVSVVSTDVSTGTVIKMTTFANSVVGAVRTSGGWDQDDLGYNVEIGLSGDYWPEADRTYSVVATYTRGGGEESFDSRFQIQST